MLHWVFREAMVSRVSGVSLRFQAFKVSIVSGFSRVPRISMVGRVGAVARVFGDSMASKVLGWCVWFCVPPARFNVPPGGFQGL